MINSMVLSWDEWVDKFKPIKNYLNNDASMDGYMFETYGNEVVFINNFNKLKPMCVWTLVDYGEGQVINEGIRYVNRMGYFITELPYDTSINYSVDEFKFEEIE